MILSYCEHCGTFIRADQMLLKENEPILCSDCATGTPRRPQRYRDSDRIPNPFRKAFSKAATAEADAKKV
jgi:hypothetical protein